MGGDELPAFMGLALDIGLASLALSVERVEGHIEVVLGRLARVDRAPLGFWCGMLYFFALLSYPERRAAGL